eukprot:TRINITY_DN22815_c0_g1_i2.p2 TRINITY_DN22815_c0_g1~~TRINITY_DN22815_c0_g1_i2.p2  ORF type:complete len:629 (-),score=68.19 TRINITY_DN22815_c0_g1_i2:395-2140(-)
MVIMLLTCLLGIVAAEWYDVNRPRFHIIPAAGFMADPDGLLFYKGDYHIMFQNNPDSISWEWNMNWGHVVCHGLLKCHHLPSSLVPSKDGPDCSGCWSGQATVDEDGTPVIVYAGSRRLDWPQCTGPTNYNPDSLQPYVETIMFATVPDPANDTELATWKKGGVLIPQPPNNGYYYHGWRDPFIYQRGNKAEGKKWIMITAGGFLNDQLESEFGGILIYSSNDLQDPESWKYEGIMASGTYPDFVMWEAPWMFETDSQDDTEYAQVLGFAGDKWDWNNPNNAEDHTGYRPNFAWLGDLNETTYKMDLSESGPILLDLGIDMYCPNIIKDDKDRRLLIGWVHECLGGNDACPNRFTWKGAGSMTTPRKMTVKGDHIFQEPVEEMDELRTGVIPDSKFENLKLVQGEQKTVLEGQHYFLDFVVTFKKGDSKSIQWEITRPISAYIAPHMIITYQWEIANLTIQWGSTTAPYNPGYPPLPYPNLAPSGVTIMGGKLNFMDENSEELTLRLFSDGSHWELFTSTGQTFSVRWFHDYYAFAGQVFKLSSMGGDAEASGIGYNMGTIWTDNPWPDNANPGAASFMEE